MTTKSPLEQAQERILALESREDELNALCLDYQIDVDALRQEREALKASLVGTVYDGTLNTLPPEDERDRPISVTRDIGGGCRQHFCLYNFEHRRLAVGDRWWPFPGGGK